MHFWTLFAGLQCVHLGCGARPLKKRARAEDQPEELRARRPWKAKGPKGAKVVEVSHETVNNLDEFRPEKTEQVRWTRVVYVA